MSRWAFSSSSSSTTDQGARRTPLGELPPLFMAHIAGGEPMSRETAWASWYSDISKRSRASSRPNRARARVRHSWVLPTPLGAQQEETPHRPPGVLQAQPPPADGPGHRLHRPVPGPAAPGAGPPPDRPGPSGPPRLGRRRAPPSTGTAPPGCGRGSTVGRPRPPPRSAGPGPAPGGSPAPRCAAWRLFKVLAAHRLGSCRPVWVTRSSSCRSSGGGVPAGQPGLGRRLVHQVDGLVREEPLGQIAHRQVHRRLQARSEMVSRWWASYRPAALGGWPGSAPGWAPGR